MKSFSFIIFTVFLFGCKNEVDSIFYDLENDGSRFILVDSFSIAIDDISTFDILFNQVADFDGAESLYVLNGVNRSLDIYGLASGELLQRIAIPHDGPAGVRSVMGFYVHNQDSIFIYPKITFQGTVLIDYDGGLINRYNPVLPYDNQVNKVLNHNSTSSSPTYYKNNRLLFDQLSLKEAGILPESADFKLSGYVDLLNDSVYLIDQAIYPQLYRDRPFFQYFKISSRVLNTDLNWVYNWELLDSLLVFDLDMNLVGKQNAKSKYRKGEPPVMVNYSPEEGIKSAVEETYYLRIVTDPENRFYYRIVSIGGEYDPKMDKSVMSADKNDFTVIVLDSEFNMIEERRFPGNTYSTFQAFATEKGLYLPKNNLNHPDLKEDVLEFEIYSIR